jgi:hypothetical protein
MSRELETPVRALIDQGHNALSDHLRWEGPQLLFVWLALIFLKTHLRDKTLYHHLDRRKGGDNDLRRR